MLIVCTAALLDIILNFKAYCWMRLSDIKRPFLKLFVAVFWVVALPACYVHSSEISTRMVNVINSKFGQRQKVPYLYTTAMIVYMLPNVVGTLFFLFPILRKCAENSRWRIIQNLLSWSEVRFSFISSVVAIFLTNKNLVYTCKAK